MFNRPINEVVREYPIVGDFLLENDVDCINCTIGTCLVKDILDIHNFSKVDQQVMLEHIELLISGKSRELKKFVPLKIQSTYHPIIEILIDEHKLIMQLIQNAQFIVSQKDFINTYRDDIQQIVHYLKYYADDFHHGKEEDVLFYLFEKNDILNVMYQEHDQGRELRKKIINEEDEDKLREYILEYVELLKDHIYKEDNILFPYLDRNLNEEMIRKIEEDLKEVDYSINDELSKYLDDFEQRVFSR